MKSTTSTALILGLIMLLLVMVAAFIFLFQGRNTLQEQRNSAQIEATALQDSLGQANANLSVVSATRSVIENDLATAVADTILLEGQLVESQQIVDDLTSQLESASDAMSSTNSAQTPAVAILSPAEGATIPVDIVNKVVIAASDAQGVTAVNVLLNGEAWQEFAAEDVTLFTKTIEWTPEETGPYEISLMAVNVNGIASELATVSVEVNQIQTSTSSLSDSNAALRNEIETAVTQIRGLEPQEPVITTFLTPEELRQRVETDLLQEYTPEDAQNEALALATFDFLPREFNLYDLVRDLYAEQIAGFYDPETNEFVVISADGALDTLEQVTYAHEYMHALQDQYFNLDLLDDENLNNDASMALRALAEGEATFVQSLYILSDDVTADELLAVSLALETPVLDNAPPILVETLQFPYLTGSKFVTALHEQGGFDALEYAWTNIPQSTEQIIHPDRFLEDDFPQQVAIPPLTSTLGTDWVLVDQDVFGEAMLRHYLAQQLNGDQVETAATGWGGDQYSVYQNTETGELVMVLRQLWDSEDDSIEFAALYPNYPSRLFDAESIIQPNGSECWYGENDVICLFQNGMETMIVRAPTLAIVEAIANEVQ